MKYAIRNYDRPEKQCIKMIFYTLGHEYQLAGGRYSWLLLASEDRRCANLRMLTYLTATDYFSHAPAEAWMDELRRQQIVVK